MVRVGQCSIVVMSATTSRLEVVMTKFRIRDEVMCNEAQAPPPLYPLLYLGTAGHVVTHGVADVICPVARASSLRSICMCIEKDRMRDAEDGDGKLEKLEDDVERTGVSLARWIRGWGIDASRSIGR